jgi:UDP-N-acetylmuramate dehydrogenase
LKIQQNISLKPYNTFGIDVIAKRFVTINQLTDLKQLVLTEKHFFILGGGSNLLLTSNIESLVIFINTKGITEQHLDEKYVLVTAQAGENWHDFVLWTLSKDFGGLENLSLIPGNVGAAPIQNIGAYGVEIKDVFYQLEALEIATGKTKIFDLNACNFGYRNSVFKNELKGKYIITSVTFKLTRQNHCLNSSYGAIKDYLQDIENCTIKDISNAVIAIRNSKLPNPKEIGNSGSFFKNPVISSKHFNKLLLQNPTMPAYKISNREVKVPAGWLIEKCGFKGIKQGEAGVHQNQALVLVNYGNASGNDILNLAKKIKNTVKINFNIDLEIEVNVV